MRKAPRARSSSPSWSATRKLFTLVMIMQQFTPPFGALAAPLNQTGRWVATPSLGFSSTHAVLLREPVTNAAKVFMFGESGTPQTMKFWRFSPGDTNLITPVTANSLSSLINLPHPDSLLTDLFCSGHATLPDGRMVLVGGSWLPVSPCREVYTLNPAWQPNVSGDPTPWTISAQMAVQRWYATATPLPDGRILASAGTMTSRMIGFGGLAHGVTMDTTWRVLQPLELATRYSWGDTTAAPGDTCTVSCNPPRLASLHQPEDFTSGRYPPGREGHVFVGDPSGRCITFGGRRRLANGNYEKLGDIWSLYDSKADDDSTHGWSLLEQVGDPALPAGQNLPGPRWGSAATWAGVENRIETHEPETTGAVICYIHGGIAIGSAGQDTVLGDLWRGERRAVTGPHYQWVWKRILAGDASTGRFGHTMMFDPGSPGDVGAPRAKLVIFGGWKSTTVLADPAKVYSVGVGSQSTQPNTWREIAVSGTAPPARAWHAMTAKWRLRSDDEREYFLFGGEGGASASSATPVAPDLWVLERPDQFSFQEDSFAWSELTTSGQGPTGRSRPGMAYHHDGELLVVAGGDTTGSNVDGGQTDALWTVQGDYLNNTTSWRQPFVRSFHPGPPPIAGMGLVALGEGQARIARSMESFGTAASSGPGADCPEFVEMLGQWQTVTTPDAASERPIADYPNIYVLPDGRLFNAGAAPSIDPGASRSHYKRFFSLESKQWEEGLTGDQQDAVEFGTSAMYRPGQILRAGSSGQVGNGKTQTVDLTSGLNSTPWVPYVDSTAGQPDQAHPTLKPRTHHNLTILPTGDVLATGGVRDDNSVNSNPIQDPQLWSVANERWSSVAQDRGEWLASDPWIRNYHSTAVLLPDARILTAGGESPSPNDAQTSASVFEPPYLFDSNDNYAPRPRVMNGPDLLPYGRALTIRLTDSTRTASIRSVALVRPGAVTHGFDQGQRYVPVNFVAREGPKRLLIQAPANANLAPPGDYLLFVVDNVGTDAPNVPSVARWVRITSATPALVDTGDVTEPRGGAVINLRDAGACTDDPSSPVLRLTWVAPADDDSVAFSGRATSYNLRYALNASAPANFNDWTAWATGSPSLPLVSEQVGVYGLSANTWYKFALKTTDDHSNTSGLSNTAIVKPSITACDGGGGGYHEGDGGFRTGGAALATSLEPGLNAIASQATENTLFPGAALDSLSTDALPFPGSPPQVDGARQVYVREGSGRGLALDRARLVAADHAPGTTVAACSDGRFLAGTRVPAAHIADRSGRDLTAEGTGAAVEPLYADSGEVLSIALPANSDSSEDVLLIETSDGTPGPIGIEVEVSNVAGAWSTATRIHPRLHASAQAVTVTGAAALRMRFGGACAVRFLGRLAEPSIAVVTSAALSSAQSRGVSWTDEVRAVDGERAILAPRDTLLLAYQDPPQPDGLARDWFLVLDGIPMSANVALFAARRAHDEREPVVAYRLHQNVPNPFAHATSIGFDLPVAADVRLEIFDLQGRLLRRFAEYRTAGRHAIEWNLSDAHGHTVPPGIYVYRLRAGAFDARLKMVVIP